MRPLGPARPPRPHWTNRVPSPREGRPRSPVAPIAAGPGQGEGSPGWPRPRNLQALAPAHLQRRALRAGEAAVSGSRVCGRCDDRPRKGQVALRPGQHPPFSLSAGPHCPARLVAVPLTCRQPHLSTLQRALLPSAQLPP